MNVNILFFEILRVALGRQLELSVAPTPEQWRDMYRMAIQQTLVGVLFSALERLPKEQRPPKEVLLQWYMLKEHIMERSRLLNQRAVETLAFFRDEGFDCCILKGQGISTLYPDPLLRTSGDIDIWLSGGRERIYDFARNRVGLKGLTYQHIHYPLHEDAEVEVHVTPGHLFAPILNHRLQRFFAAYAAAQWRHEVELPEEVGSISVPTAEFNRVFILLHIYMHLFGEGIGLRQVLDYYYVLRQPATAESRERTVATLRQLRMMRFARAMMWVMAEVFGLEEEYLITAPDEREGRFLLSEIMLAGNFGKYDARINRTRHHLLFPRLYNSLRRNWKFFIRYPHEMVWDVPFRTWQYVWSRLKLRG
ncbi:MAG: nucleotidyltransferase family protein [Bacteroidaceae bacterium]|nr:nucleotidyltransferase family protein [Bacteroidaceae bacterium]